MSSYTDRGISTGGLTIAHVPSSRANANALAEPGPHQYLSQRTRWSDVRGRQEFSCSELFSTRVTLLTLLDSGQHSLHRIEATLPHRAVIREPTVNFLQRRQLQPARPPLRLLAAGDE